MKKFLFLFIVVMVHFYANAQLFVSSYGEITIPNRLFLTGNGNTFRFLPNNPGTEIGTSTDRINFWYSEVGWNNLYAQSYYTASDSRLKRDIMPLKNSMDILLKIKTYTYNMIDNEEKETRRHHGVLAQELREILPDAVSETKDSMLAVDYIAFIPLLINAMQEQYARMQERDRQIESLQQVVALQEQQMLTMQEDMNRCCKNIVIQKSALQNDNTVVDIPVLYQNTPNPFSAGTEIRCYLPEQTRDAFLFVYNLNGEQLLSFTLQGTGEQTVNINGASLPAGMYLYSLVVNGNIADTKRMILTK